MKHNITIGNIGTIPANPDTEDEAAKLFAEYYHQSISNYGRASGEDVTWSVDDEPVFEFIGYLSAQEDRSLYEVVDHGVDHAQYFSFPSAMHTKFDESYFGCGSTYREALDDALESFALSEDNKYKRQAIIACIESDPALKIDDETNEKYSVEAELRSQGLINDDGEWPDECELYYYVSIRV